MTPTLLGRWQQRLLVLPTIGLLVSLPLAISQRHWYYIIVLFYIGIGGCLWDVLYQQLQKMRWDNDWPGVLQLAGAVGEGLLLSILLKVNMITGTKASELFGIMPLVHYAIISVAMFVVSQSVLPVLFPHARYRGRQWL